MKKLILIGGGGHCISCIDVIELEGIYKIAGILDMEDKVGSYVLNHEIIGTDESISKYCQAGYYFLITLGQIKSAQARKTIYERLLENKAKIATIVSPRAYISKHATIETGTIVMHDAFVNAGAKIQQNCIINTKAIIEHQCRIEAHCHISTGAVINGNVKIKEGTFFGSNAVSKENIETQSNDFIRAGRCYVGPPKKNKKIAFLTTLFPICENYLHDFLQSLTNQTWKEFDLIVLNDGFNDFHRFKEQYNNLNIIEIPSANNIAKNREALIKFSLINNYDIAVFGDIDDYFTDNRIEVASKLLNKNDIVVNDLTSFSIKGKLLNNYLSNRLTNGEYISLDFILDKNIFGLSNTAINLSAIKSADITFDDELLAVDWYFFSCLLLNNKQAIFTNEAVTYYRQHDNNIAGLGEMNGATIQKSLAIKLMHFDKMALKTDAFVIAYDKTLRLSVLSQNEIQLDALLLKNRINLKFPLWWEIIE
jgi:sugar O-acyltransferase (sialic acid O-acetyltransferase NeuD family)